MRGVRHPGVPTTPRDRPGGRRTWRGDYRSALFAWVAAGTAAVGALVILTVPEDALTRWFFAIFFAAVTAFSLLMTHIRVSAGADGLVVRTAVPWIRLRRISVERIASVRATMIEPGDLGGWGNRWLPGVGWSLLLRRSPGLVVELVNGRRFAVTLPHEGDAERAADVLVREIAPEDR